MADRQVVTVVTDAGMLALWSTSAFEDVDGYEAWEARVNERLGAAIAGGELVPVGIQADGAFGVRVVVAPDDLTLREQQYSFMTSEPYFLKVEGGEVCLSGVEKVGSPEYAELRLQLSDGRYTVRVTLVDWDAEPGSRNSKGTPTESALADFVVAISPAIGSETYRTEEPTFPDPGA